MSFTPEMLIYISPSLFSIAALLFILHSVWRYDVPYRWSMISMFFFMTCISTIWLLERFASTLNIALFLVALEYLVLAALMVSTLAFVVEYLGMFSMVTKRNVFIFSILGAIVFLLNITNAWHGLVYTSEVILENSGLYYMRAEYGPVLYLHLLNVSILVGLSLMLLFRAIRDSPPIMRKGPTVVMLAILSMVASAVIYLASPRDNPLIDIFSLCIAISAFIMLYGERSFIFIGHEPIKLQDAIEATDDSFLILNMRLELIYQNHSAGLLLKSNPDFLSNLDIDVDEKETGWTEISLDLEGERRWFDMRYTVLKRENRRIGVSLLLHDISTRKETEEDLMMSKERNQTLSRIIEHDIKNDLSVIVGYLDLILESKEGSDRRLLKIQERADNIQYHLDFASEYRHIGEQSALFQSLAGSILKGKAGLDLQSLIVTMDVGNEQIFADPMLSRVFYNLFDNTIRHGEKAQSVRIWTEFIGDRCIIRYQDDGVGIPEEMKERMFDAHARGGRQHGMILIKEILQMTDIDIVEEGADGACFTMTVPAGGWRAGDGMGP